MNGSRRVAALLAAQYIEDNDSPSEAGYAALMALVSDLRSEEYKAVKNLARYRDKDERSREYHDVALAAFPHLQIADDELKRGLKLGEWEPEVVVKALRESASATGATAKEKPRRMLKKGLRKS